MLSRSIALRHATANSRRLIRPATTDLPPLLQCIAGHQLRAGARWYTNDPPEKKKKNPFQGQVWENTYKRIQEESAEIDRYLKEREDKEKRRGDKKPWVAPTLGVGIGMVLCPSHTSTLTLTE